MTQTLENFLRTYNGTDNVILKVPVHKRKDLIRNQEVDMKDNIVLLELPEQFADLQNRSSMTDETRYKLTDKVRTFSYTEIIDKVKNFIGNNHTSTPFIQKRKLQETCANNDVQQTEHSFYIKKKEVLDTPVKEVHVIKTGNSIVFERLDKQDMTVCDINRVLNHLQQTNKISNVEGDSKKYTLIIK